MKKITLFLTLSLLLSAGLWAQPQRREVVIVEETSATTPAPPRDTVAQRREVIIIDEPATPHSLAEKDRYDEKKKVYVTDDWAFHVPDSDDDGWRFIPMIGLGYNGLITNLEEMELPDGAEWMELDPKSINFRLRLAEYAFSPFNTKHFGIQAGLELEAANFRFSDRHMIPGLSRDGNNVEGKYVDYELKKSKLVNTYLNLPVVLRVGFGRRNQLTLYGGVVGGWRFSSYVKEKSSAHGKDHHRGNLNLRTFHYGYTAGIKIHNFGVYASYYPQSIFKAGKGPDVRQATIGFSLFY